MGERAAGHGRARARLDRQRRDGHRRRRRRHRLCRDERSFRRGPAMGAVPGGGVGPAGARPQRLCRAGAAAAATQRSLCVADRAADGLVQGRTAGRAAARIAGVQGVRSHRRLAGKPVDRQHPADADHGRQPRRRGRAAELRLHHSRPARRRARRGRDADAVLGRALQRVLPAGRARGGGALRLHRQRARRPPRKPCSCCRRPTARAAGWTSC